MYPLVSYQFVKFKFPAKCQLNPARLQARRFYLVNACYSICQRTARPSLTSLNDVDVFNFYLLSVLALPEPDFRVRGSALKQGG
jgi:hypothetical protein